MKFKLNSQFKPSGDQPKAINALLDGLAKNKKDQILMGVTGSGKTFTIANVIAKINRPTLIIAHNKTLAAQLCSEFREFFPENAVEYFVSYYDYYQPESYLPSRDLYIEKEADINEEIEKLRHSATRSLLTRKDVIIVASVSCIYGLGTPEDYLKGILIFKIGQKINRKKILLDLENIQYHRNDIEIKRGCYRIKGDTIDIYSSWDDYIIRLDCFDDFLDKIYIIHPITGEIKQSLNTIEIFPATHYVVGSTLKNAILKIEKELEEQLINLKKQGKDLEAKRLEQRTKYDLDMLQEMGYCKGIENYSRHISNRKAGSPPGVLIDFFKNDFLTVIDESHVTIGQIRGMYAGDKARKQTLIEYGFRLPSASDNRPLMFEEFTKKIGQTIYVSATPGDYELELCKTDISNNTNSIWKGYDIVEQIIRPTGLVDPEIIIKPSKHQIDDLMERINICIKRKERVLITAITKKMSENIADYLENKGIKVQYLHSEINAIDRIDILHDLRTGKYDVLVGVNLLREGLDLPEVSLVAILDADKEGFLRNERSLIQTMGRAARNMHGQVVLYADKITNSINRAVKETNRRRKIQLNYNKIHNIKPKSISKKIKDIRENEREIIKTMDKKLKQISPTKLPNLISQLEKEMQEASKNLDFELAIIIRDKIKNLNKLL